MDEFTEKQLERIREANFKMLERVFDDEPWADTTDELIAELRKKPVTFRKGELYWDEGIGIGIRLSVAVVGVLAVVLGLCWIIFT